MTKQRVPDIDWGPWVIGIIPDLFTKKEIYINREYQRGDIWTHTQKVDLIKSINNGYSIGVIVLFINDSKQYEILDGQQRLVTIQQYLNDSINLTGTDISKYSELDKQEKTLFDAYCVYYIRLKSHDPASKEEDIVQTFLRLQEGTPLNKAEKINAYRGAFKDLFREIREKHPLFSYLGNEKRFRFRQLAAELLTLESESDFTNKIFPGLDVNTLITTIKKYGKGIEPKKVAAFKGNLDYLSQSLNMILTAFKLSEVISFYLLVSYLRKSKADNKNLMNEIAAFSREFLKNLNSFSIYDNTPPKGMSIELFNNYRDYKLEAKVMTTPESIRKRFDIILSEYKRLYPFITKDPKRLIDVEQRRILFFRQKGLCAKCGKALHFRLSSAHHIVRHAKGGKTDDLDKAALVHAKCHEKIEKEIEKGIEPVLPFK